jgi:endonuclease-3
MTPAIIKKIFTRFRQVNPHPTTELLFSTPFELLASVLLAAQATDVGVNKATRLLFPIANTPEALLQFSEETLMPYLKTLNLYKTKTKNLLKTCAILVERYNGEVPKTREALESLPGVGRKTANVVLNTAFGEPTIAVDTHIFRVSNRTNIAPGKTVLEVEQKLLKVVPKPFLSNAHHWLVLHGRYVCKARKPLCANCLIADLCEYPDKTS